MNIPCEILVAMNECAAKTSRSSSTQMSVKSPTCSSVRNLSDSRKKNLTELNNYIKVGVRVRPINSVEKRYVIHNTIKFRGKDFVVECPRSPWTLHGQDHIFQYDHMFWSCDDSNTYATQEDVYNSMGKPMVENLMKGYNGSLFVYGQVGSGKTYTMIGKSVEDIDDIENSGILPRLSRELFQKLSQYDSYTYKVEVTNYEIYKEKIYDLLGAQEDKKPLRVREHPEKGPYVENLTIKTVTQYDQLRDCISTGYENRLCHPNTLNERSSKSHSIFCINLTLQLENGSYRTGRVWLVDLAGSERLQQHGVPEEHLVSTNRSLFTLGKVIAALGQRKKGNTFVSYRDSVLTWLLRQCLGGNSLTSMIATITPASSKVMETLATLRYVKQARLIVNPATVNTNDGGSIGAAGEDFARRTSALSVNVRPRTVPGAGGDIVDDETRKRARRYADTLQSALGPYSDRLGDDVIINFLKANDSSSTIIKNGGAMADFENMDSTSLKSGDITACFNSMYDLIMQIRSKIGPEDLHLRDSYRECKHSIHKFERILWKHLALITTEIATGSHITVNAGDHGDENNCNN